jgi:hypothetical protein
VDYSSTQSLNGPLHSPSDPPKRTHEIRGLGYDLRELGRLLDALVQARNHAAQLGQYGSRRGRGRQSLNLDEFAVWNSALSATQVAALYNQEYPIYLLVNGSNNYAAANSLVAWWRFGEATGDSLTVQKDVKGRIPRDAHERHRG